MINIYTPDQQEKIRKSGQITALVMEKVKKAAKVGVTPLELDALAEKEILAMGGKPSFKMEKDYFHTTCMCVNDVVVHGIPTDTPLVDGDVLGIDLGSVFEGFHSDASWSVIVGKSSHPEVERFLNVGEKALKEAIKACRVGNRIGHISEAIQKTIEAANYSCVKQLVGHGVGYTLHEDPEIPCYVRGKIANTPEIKEGMVLALEAIYNMGDSAVAYSEIDDGWTIVTRDGSLSGLFEHTVLVTKNGPVIATI